MTCRTTGAGPPPISFIKIRLVFTSPHSRPDRANKQDDGQGREQPLGARPTCGGVAQSLVTCNEQLRIDLNVKIVCIKFLFLFPYLTSPARSLYSVADSL